MGLPVPLEDKVVVLEGGALEKAGLADRSRHCHCSLAGFLQLVTAAVAVFPVPNSPRFVALSLGLVHIVNPHLTSDCLLFVHLHQLTWGIPEEKMATDGPRSSVLDHHPLGLM